MWFYIPAIIVILTFVWWFRRTHIYRHFRSGHFVEPGQPGKTSAQGWEGGAGPPGGGALPG